MSRPGPGSFALPFRPRACPTGPWLAAAGLSRPSRFAEPRLSTPGLRPPCIACPAEPSLSALLLGPSARPCPAVSSWPPEPFQPRRGAPILTIANFAWAASPRSFALPLRSLACSTALRLSAPCPARPSCCALPRLSTADLCPPRLTWPARPCHAYACQTVPGQAFVAFPGEAASVTFTCSHTSPLPPLREWLSRASAYRTLQCQSGRSGSRTLQAHLGRASPSQTTPVLP